MAFKAAMSKGGVTAPQRPPLLLRIKQFLIEAWFELRKVLWPSRQEAIRFTLVVLGVIIVVAIFIWACDIILTRLSGPLFNLGPTP